MADQADQEPNPKEAFSSPDLLVQPEGNRIVDARRDINNSIINQGDNNTFTQTGLADRQFAELQQGQQDQQSDLKEIKELIKGRDTSRVVQKFAGKVDLVGELSSEGQLNAALAAGETASRTLPADTPLKDRVRLFAILSGVYLQLGQHDEAITRVETSLAQDLENLTLIENAANTHLVGGNLEQAHNLAKQALEKENSASALSVLIQVAFEQQGRPAVEDLLEQNEWGLVEQIVHTALAVTYIRDENYEQAEASLRRMLPQDLNEPHEADHLTYLVQLLIDRAQQIFSQNLPAPWLSTAEQHADLTEALELSSKVVDFWRGRQPVTKLARALTERAVAHLLRNDVSSAYSDLEEASKLGGNDDLFVLTQARVLLNLEQPKKLVAMAESISSTERPKGLEGLLGAAHLKLKHFNAAAEAFERELPNAETENERLAVLDSLLDAYVLLGDEVNTERLRQLVETEGARRATSLASLAAYHYARDERETAHQLFRQALTLPVGSDLVRLDYADILAKERQWLAAADLLTPMASLEAPEWVLERYAACLYNAQRYKEALSFTRSVRKHYGVKSVISAVEADICHLASDYNMAIILLKELERLEPDNPRHLFNLLAAYVGLGDGAEAKNVFRQIDPDGVRDEPSKLMWLAEMAQALDESTATELAWEAQRAAPGNHALFASYANVLIKAKDVEDESATVARDTTATLTLPSGATSILTLLDRSDIRGDELNLDDPRATKLLGRRVGERIPWGQTSAGPTFATIVKVRHKYVARFQDTNPNDLPSEQPLLELFHTPEGGLPQGLIERLKINAEAQQEVFSRYAEMRTFPLQALAFMGGDSLAWTRQLLMLQQRPLRAFEGSQIMALKDLERRNRMEWLSVSIDALRHRRVKNAKRAVLDESALLTLADLNALSLLEQRYDEVLVPQTVVNALDKEVTRVTDRLNPGGVPSEVQGIAQARQWARSHATLIPGYTRLLDPNERLEKFGQILPPHCLDALIIAEEQGIPLFTDDGGLTNIIRSIWNVNTTNTRHLLDDCVEQGSIAAKDYADAIATLIELNYTFISFNVKHLMVLFVEQGVSPAFRRLVTKFGAPDVDAISALRVAIDFFDQLVFGHPQTAKLRDEAIVLVLEALTERDSPDEVVQVLQSRFLSYPEGQKLSLVFLHRRLEDWLRTKRQTEAG